MTISSKPSLKTEAAEGEAKIFTPSTQETLSPRSRRRLIS